MYGKLLLDFEELYEKIEALMDVIFKEAKEMSDDFDETAYEVYNFFQEAMHHH